MKSNQIDNNALGYVYLSESVSPDNQLKNVDSNHRDGLFYVTFDTNLQDFDVQNRNMRYYDGDNIWECIMSEKIQSLLRTGGWFGEFDHPEAEIDGEKLSPKRIQNVPPQYRAFKIMKPRRVGNVLQASIQSAQGAVGESFGKEVLAGWQPQFSVRAIATMIMKNGKPYVAVKRLITYDAPWFPSHAIAHAISPAKVTTKSFTESVASGINTVKESAKEKANDIMISLKDILSDISEKDVTAGMVMEAFDLGFDDLVGFDDSHRHMMIRDNDNVLYVNINPESVKKVNDFYRSF